MIELTGKTFKTAKAELVSAQILGVQTSLTGEKDITFCYQGSPDNKHTCHISVFVEIVIANEELAGFALDNNPQVRETVALRSADVKLLKQMAADQGNPKHVVDAAFDSLSKAITLSEEQLWLWELFSKAERVVAKAASVAFMNKETLQRAKIHQHAKKSLVSKALVQRETVLSAIS